MAAKLQSILLKKTYRLIYQIILLITNYFTILFWSAFHQYEVKGTTLSNSFLLWLLFLPAVPLSARYTNVIVLHERNYKHTSSAKIRTILGKSGPC